MALQSPALYGLNRGEVSSLALGRVDVDRLRLSAETQLNWLPRTIGPMMLRPGTQFVCEVANDAPCRYLPFIFGSSDTALLEFTDSTLRVLVNETPITRVSVGTTVPAFASWTSNASTGATVSLGSTIDISGNLSGLTSQATMALTVASGDQAKEHALRVVVGIGPVTFRLGTASGLDDIFASTSLDQGTHSLAFTPGQGTVYVQFETSVYALRRVSSVAMESAGIMTLPTPFAQASLRGLSFETSADVMFIAGGGLQQRRVERHGAHSYSISLYKVDDGPFPAASGDGSVLISPSALIGNVTLTSNKSTFKSGHIGSLIRLFHNGQNSVRSLAAPNTYSDVIRVAGVSKITPAGSTTTTATHDRDFVLTISGTWSGTLRLQRSLESATAGFTDYQTYSSNTGPTTITDNLDNVVAWYRIGFGASDYTSGTASVQLSYTGGGAAGIARITGYNSPTSVSAEVMSPFSNTTGATDWRLQEWSQIAGFPSSVAIHEGRLWWAGSTRIWGSVSDAYTSYDIDVAGDSGVIDRSIGHGPIQNINWLLPLNRLMLGGDSSIITARSNYLDQPLTPTVFTLKDSMTIAASSLQAVKIDLAAIFVSQSGRKAYEAGFDVSMSDYQSNDLTRLNPDIGLVGFIDIAVQREPDTRVHLVRADGQVAVLLYDKADQVEAWWRLQTDGVIENVVVLPGPIESRVYYVVNRTVNGATKRYLERCARIDECQGGTLNKNIDCHAIYQGAPTTTLTGLGYLEGKAVVAWADGKEVGLNAAAPSDPASYTVSGGSITLPVAVSNAVVGLPYTAQFKSAKLAYAAQNGTAINQVKRVDHVGFQFVNSHALGVKYGPDFSTLDDLPLIEDGAVVDVTALRSTYDQQMIEFPGQYDTDSRICLQGQAPRPCTILGITLEIATSG